MNTKYEQIVDVNNIATSKANEGLFKVIELASEENVSKAREDSKKVLLLAIDIQNDFMEELGSLGVASSKDDVKRLTHFIYNNIDKITQIMCSLDNHIPMQVFHPCWWINKEGVNPEPYTIISYKDVLEEKWIPVNGEKERMLEYLEEIEKLGRRQLCIWPYHCLQGTSGANLENEFSNMIYFHSVARNSEPIFINKGMNPYSEMYGIIKPEYDLEEYINKDVLNKIEQFDEIYIAGEASSHCVLESVRQILEYFKARKDITRRITILKDCMSSIQGYEDMTEKEFNSFRNIYGINIANTTDIII